MKDERDLYKEIICTSLEGRTLEKFVVFNGSGRNGKGLLNDILLKALGNHAYVLKNTVLTSETKNGPNPELASLERKRLVIAREPQGKFNNSVIKEVTGGSVLNARFNHSNHCKVNLQLTLVVECNTKPKFMEDISDGEANRLIDILFRCHYTEDKTMVDASNYIYEAKREYKNEEFQDRMKTSMIKILRDTYKEYKKRDYNFIIPDSIKKNTQNYLKNSSDFISWFNETYERCEEPESMVSIQDVFEKYRVSEEYGKLDRSEKKRMTKQYMLDLFSRNVMFRKVYRERYRKTNMDRRNVLLNYRIRQEVGDEAELII
jgi:phage/plasmid-associated DNA primase